MKIATILTCYNRKDKTLSCLSSLFHALEKYNLQTEDKIELTIYLTDDGCTDGTSEAVSDAFRQKDIHIQQGDGNLFWAGGMRLSWNEALKKHKEWSHYLLLNDDTDILEDCFDELFKTEDFSKRNYGQEAIVSGICCAKDDPTKLTYGGDVWVNRFLATSKRLNTSFQPQMVDMTNANILLVPTSVVDILGIFSKEYIHGAADYDYTVRARKEKIPVLITANFCGACDNDHENTAERSLKIISMSRSERKKYFSFPPRSGKDHLTFYKANVPIRYPLVWLGRALQQKLPRIYFWLNGLR